MSKRNGSTDEEFVPTERELAQQRDYEAIKAKERAEWDALFESNRDWLESDQRHGYVYFLEDGDHMKIGWARDVRERIKFIQTGNPRQVDLVDAIADERAQNLEKILHFFFRKHHIKGEWYNYWIPADEREQIIAEVEEWAKSIVETIRAL